MNSSCLAPCLPLFFFRFLFIPLLLCVRSCSLYRLGHGGLTVDCRGLGRSRLDSDSWPRQNALYLSSSRTVGQASYNALECTDFTRKPSHAACPHLPLNYPLTHACTTGLQSAHSTRAHDTGRICLCWPRYVCRGTAQEAPRQVSAQCQPRRRRSSTLSLLSLPPTAMHTQTGAPCLTHTTCHPVQHTCSMIDSTSCPSAHVCLPRLARCT